MSDSEFESSPEDPWITQDELVSDSFPAAVDVEKMADVEGLEAHKLSVKIRQTK